MVRLLGFPRFFFATIFSILIYYAHDKNYLYVAYISAVFDIAFILTKVTKIGLPKRLLATLYIFLAFAVSLYKFNITLPIIFISSFLVLLTSHFSTEFWMWVGRGREKQDEHIQELDTTVWGWVLPTRIRAFYVLSSQLLLNFFGLFLYASALRFLYEGYGFLQFFLWCLVSVLSFIFISGFDRSVGDWHQYILNKRKNNP